MPHVSAQTESKVGNVIAKAILRAGSSGIPVHLPSSLPPTLRFPPLTSLMRLHAEMEAILEHRPPASALTWFRFHLNVDSLSPRRMTYNVQVLWRLRNRRRGGYDLDIF